MYKVKTIECFMKDIEGDLEEVLNCIDGKIIQIMQSIIQYDITYTKVLITIVYEEEIEYDD